MKINWLLSTIIFATFISCSDTWKIKQSIKLWEYNQNNCKVIKVLQLDSLQSFTNADSAKILLKEYTEYKTDKFKSLNTELSLIDQRIKNSQRKLDSSDNDLMQKAIKHKLYELDKEREKCWQIIDLYTNQPEQTNFENYKNKLSYYANSPQTIIGYLQPVTIVLSQGHLAADTIHKVYIIDDQLKQIFGYYCE